MVHELRAARARTSGIGPAHIAAQYGDTTLMKYLIANEFPVYHATNMHETPLTIAVTHEQGGCIQLLLDHGKPIVPATNLINLILFLAHNEAIQTNTMEQLLRGSRARSGIHFAAANGYTEVRYL